MAIINMSFKTKTKTCSFKMDDTEMGDVSGLTVYKCDSDKYCMELRQMTKDSENDMMQYSGLCASLIKAITNNSAKLLEKITKY